MVGGGVTILPEISGQPAPVGAKSPNLNRFARSASAVKPIAKKVQLTLIGSPQFCGLSLLCGAQGQRTMIILLIL